MSGVWALQVTYSAPGRDVLRVRTVRGSLDWTPVIRTIENLQTTMGTYSPLTRRSAEFEEYIARRRAQG